MQFVYEVCAKILLNGRHAAADAHVFIFRSLLRSLQGGMDSVSHEVKCCPAFHLNGLPRMMCQHERRHMIRRVPPPPPLPYHGLPHAAPPSPNCAIAAYSHAVL